MKAGERQACISTSSDWLSCTAMPRASPTGWPAQALGRPGLVERVAGLVQHAHQRRDELVLAVAGGDADVGGRAAAERVRALVEPAGVEVEAEPRHQRACPSAFWRSAGNGPAGVSGGRRRRLAGQDRLDQRAAARGRAGRTAARPRRRAGRAGARRAARRRAEGRGRRR